MKSTIKTILLCGIILISLSNSFRAQNKNLEQIFEEFWDAGTKDEREKAAKKIIKHDAGFEDVYKQFQQGKNYSASQKTGFIEWQTDISDGLRLYSLIFVPHNYRPEKKYPVKLFLHGGSQLSNPRAIDKMINRQSPEYDSVEYFIVYPSAWAKAEWWFENQQEHIRKILYKLKSLYNIDENHLNITGISAGGIGAYRTVNSNPTPFSGCITFIGSMEDLNWAKKTKQIYLRNYLNTPFLIINGGQDKTFPPDLVVPYVNALRSAGGNVRFFMIDTASHNLAWYPLMEDKIEPFFQNTIRNPLPDTLCFETETTDNYNRLFWLRIDKSGKTKHDSDIDELNTVIVKGMKAPAFNREKQSGIIEVQKSGNTVKVKTKGIKKYTLLLSPEHFDFDKNIEIITNEQLSFNNKIEKSKETLVKYAAQDNDRTMLFAAEITIKVGKTVK